MLQSGVQQSRTHCKENETRVADSEAEERSTAGEPNWFSKKESPTGETSTARRLRVHRTGVGCGGREQEHDEWSGLGTRAETAGARWSRGRARRLPA